MICTKIAFGHSIFCRSFNISLSSWTITANSRSDTIPFSSCSPPPPPSHFWILTPFIYFLNHLQHYLISSFLLLLSESDSSLCSREVHFSSFSPAPNEYSQQPSILYISSIFILLSYFWLLVNLNFQFPQGIFHQRICYTFLVCPTISKEQPTSSRTFDNTNYR